LPKNGNRTTWENKMQELKNTYSQREALPLPVTGLILCGGRSRRMGRPKAFLPYNGSTMISHILDSVRDVFAEVLLIANEPELFSDLDVDVVKDILPYRGPLGGILSGLLVAQHHHSFVLACDMPFVDKRLLREMSMRRHGSDVLVLMHPSGIEPLLGIYSKSCIKPLEEALFAGEPSLNDFVSGLNAETFYYDMDAADNFPPYFNIDTPQDYSRAITGVVNGGW